MKIITKKAYIPLRDQGINKEKMQNTEFSKVKEEGSNGMTTLKDSKEVN